MNRRSFPHPEGQGNGMQVMDIEFQTSDEVRDWKAATVPPDGWRSVIEWNGTKMRLTFERANTPGVKVVAKPTKGRRTLAEIKTELGMRQIQYPRDATPDQLEALLK